MDEFEKQLQQLRLEFLQETRDRLENVVGQIITLENKFDPAVVKEVVRTVHSLKGAGGSYDVPFLTSICHRFEDDFNNLTNMDDAKPYLELVDMMSDEVKFHLETGHTSEQVKAHELAMQERLAGIGDHQILRVLVAENSKSTFNQIVRLGKGRIKASYVKDGLTALTRALGEDFDIIMIGRHLAILSGPACIAALKGNESKPAPKTVLLTSQTLQWPDPKLAPDEIILRNASYHQNIEAVIAGAVKAA